MRSVRQTETD